MGNWSTHEKALVGKAAKDVLVEAVEGSGRRGEKFRAVRAGEKKNLTRTQTNQKKGAQEEKDN